VSALAVSSSAPELLSTVRVAPSILSADYGRLSEQVNEVLRAGARVIHFDIMDGHFVPPITFGPIVVAALSELVHGRRHRRRAPDDRATRAAGGRVRPRRSRPDHGSC
jgi:hypothetical protein